MPSSRMRTAEIHRSTAETTIRVAVNLDGSGQADIRTGIVFFDHMLTLLARHSLMDLTIEAKVAVTPFLVPATLKSISP